MILDAAGFTDTGLVRSVNQDAGFCDFSSGAGLFVVADGVGGHYKGEIASRMLVGALEQWWQKNRSQVGNLPFYDVVDFLEKEIRRANEQILEEYRRCGQQGGCTVCVLLLCGDKYAVLHAGDSRVYLCDGTKCVSLTQDDTWENKPEIRALAETTDISGDARMGRLTKAVGNKPEISVTVRTDQIRGKSLFFLCSDGVYKYMDEKKFLRELRRGRREKHASSLNERLREKVYKNGAGDNFSMISVLAAER